jgi:hypothetical protein
MEKLKKNNTKNISKQNKKNKIKTGKMWLWSGLMEKYIDCNN